MACEFHSCECAIIDSINLRWRQAAEPSYHCKSTIRLVKSRVRTSNCFFLLLRQYTDVSQGENQGSGGCCEVDRLSLLLCLLFYYPRILLAT